MGGGFLLFVVVACCSSAPASDNAGNRGGPLAVPSDFSHLLSPPGVNDDFGRPAAIHHDPLTGEILVADMGRNRILIFDKSGAFRFSFSGGDRFSTPTDLTVEPEGTILILANVGNRRELVRCDFDGMFLGLVNLEHHGGALPADYRSVAVASGGRVVVSEHATRAVEVHGRDGSLLKRFPVLDSLDPEEVYGQGIGKISVHDDLVYVPIPTLGTVRVFDLDGEHLRSFGYPGGKVGQLAFPIAAEVAPDGTVLVLDKNRFAVLCYRPDGRFAGEFGGKGAAPGWFYYPGLLAVDGDGRIYVGQVFKSRVQVCRIPESIRIRIHDAGPGSRS